MNHPAPLVAVTGSLPLGGSSTFLVNFARAMRRRGLIIPIVVLDTENAYARDFEAIGNPVHCLPNRKLIYEDRLLWSYRQTAEYAPRAVLSCLSSESFEIFRVVPDGVLRMSIVQSDDPGPYRGAAAYGPWTDVAVGVSHQIAEKLRAAPELRHARVESIPYGIDFPPAKPREIRPPDAPLRAIYLGRMVEEQKRISRIAQLARILETRGAKVELTIAGDGPQRESLQCELKSCGLVRFLDAVPYDQVPALLLQHDAFVLLSDFEGLPLSLLEAMGCGVVPIVSDLSSGISDVVAASRGFRVPIGDVSRAAEILIDLSRDQPTLQQFSENARAFVRTEYSADLMAERYCNLIGEVAKRAHGWPPTVEIPVPIGVERPWLFRGLPRCLRRWTRQLIN
jgi:glycosyltransferase involved in cell wall biosynthesis